MTHTGGIDDAPMRPFHIRIAVATTGGFFVDGYILGTIGLAIPLVVSSMKLGPIWAGVLGASALIGIFVGTLVFGPLTDKVGRQTMYLADLAVFVVVSGLQLFATGPLFLVALRFVLGLAIGADYVIAPALLSEFVPRKRRGQILSGLVACWTLGFVAAYGAGLALEGLGPHAWRWLLASSAIPALITLLLRIGTPESPRWLLSKGYVERARQVIKKHFGPSYDVDEIASPDEPASYRQLFTRRYRRRTVFAGLFWFCQVFPYFGISTFLPTVLDSLNIHDATRGVLLYNIFLAAGAITVFFIMDKLPRRQLLIWSFLIVTVCLGLLGLVPGADPIVIIPVVMILAFVIAGSADLQTVYPAECFPTEVRGSGVGVAAAISRIGGAIATFIMPVSLADLGIGPTMLITAGVTAVGLLVSIVLAPETRHLPLHDSSAGTTMRTEGGNIEELQEN